MSVVLDDGGMKADRGEVEGSRRLAGGRSGRIRIEKYEDCTLGPWDIEEWDIEEQEIEEIMVYIDMVCNTKTLACKKKPPKI